MTTQRRRTAGIRLVHGSTHLHIDPGPGALVFSNWANLSPQSLDGLVVTHCHPDHYNDAEVFMEAMTRGTTSRRGVLAAARSVLYGVDDVGPSISDYHKKLVEEVVTLEPGVGFKVGQLSMKAVEARHSDPSTVGVRVSVPRLGSIGYTSDTGYFPELSGHYKALRLMILCVMWPRNNPIKLHLCTDEAKQLIEEAKPGCAVLTHFGMRMLNAGPEGEAEYLSQETGVPVVAARDGLKVVLDGKVTFVGPRKSDKAFTVDA
jgi:phosphoribosyl 1,2-cyclic phosphodiesterase